MGARLAQLLSAFREAADTYTLARLEFANEHPRVPAPPALALGGHRGEGPARDGWDAVEEQMEAAHRFVASLGTGRDPADPAGLRLRARVRELDRYARAVRVVLTVEERGEA